MSMTVTSLVTEVITVVDGVVPDLAIYIGASVVISLAVLLFRRAVRAAR